MSEVLDTEIEKVDIIRERMGVSYEAAMNALAQAHGDVLRALADLEKKEQVLLPEWSERGQKIWDSVQEKMKDFNKVRVSLKRHNKTIFTVSAPLGVALAYTLWRRPGLRMLGLMGAAGAALNEYQWEIDRPLENNPTEALHNQSELGI